MAVDVTNIELYEALSPKIGQDAARLIAEVVPRADQVATKDFVRDELRGSEERVMARIDRLERWMMFLIGPLWAGGIAAIVRTLFFA